MFPLTIKTCLQFLLSIFIIDFVHGQDRKITAELHPGCDACNDNDTLMYIKAEGSHDTIHQIWDFTGGVPTVILALTGHNSTLNISWSGRHPEMFSLSEKPKYSFATAIDKLYEYNDTQDNGFIDEHSPRTALYFSRVKWTLRSVTNRKEEVMVQMRGHFYEDRRHGFVDIKLDLLPYTDYAVELPHLIHTANSTLLDLSLVNLTTSPEYSAARFALHMLLISQDWRNDTMRCAMRKSLDDEHTPGVFEIIEIKSPECWRADAGGFLQFRPVAYTEPQRGVASATYLRVSEFNRTAIPEPSTAGMFFNKFDPERLLVQDMLVSFGEAGDGYYRHHNFTAWSLTVGYGTPPIESFSVFVIVMISIGLGVPVVLALSGVAFVLARRIRGRNAPARFTDEH